MNDDKKDRAGGELVFKSHIGPVGPFDFSIAPDAREIREATLTPSDAVPPDDPALHKFVDANIADVEAQIAAEDEVEVTNLRDPIPLHALGSAGVWLTSSALSESNAEVERLTAALADEREARERDAKTWADTMTQEREEFWREREALDLARKENKQLHAMLRAIALGGAGESASVLLCHREDGTEYIVTAPTLNEEIIAEKLREVLASFDRDDCGAGEIAELDRALSSTEKP